MISSVHSHSSAVTSGVIQSSIFGPTLYVLYTSDLPAAYLDCSVGQYADDTKVSKPIVEPRDRIIIQLSLDALCDWAVQHELRLIIRKMLVPADKLSRRNDQLCHRLARLKTVLVCHRPWHYCPIKSQAWPTLYPHCHQDQCVY